jgi:outer membrane protein assembly factor BamB
LLLSVLLLGCSGPSAPLDTVGPPVCDGGANSPAATVERSVAVIGKGGNSIRRADDDLYVVQSLENTVAKFDLSTQQFETLVDVGNERNPWDLIIGTDEIWITNYLTNTVTVARRETGEVLVEIEHESFDGPAGIAALGQFVYVGNVQFDGEEYGAGAVTVIDRRSREVLGSVATVRQNPQALDVVDGRLMAVDSGAFGFDDDGAFETGEAAIELWTPTEDPLQPDVETIVLPPTDDRTIGIPGRPADGNESPVVYFPSGTAPVVFALDLQTSQWRRGSDDPIRLYETTRDALHHAAMGADGVLYVTAFNEDKLFLVDTSCDEVLDEVLLEDSTFLGGPHGVIPVSVADGVDAYFVLSLANELGRVHMDFGE